MMKKFLIKPVLFVALLGVLVVYACSKPEIGYLSEHIFYLANPFRVEQGKTTYSSPIVGNGSTNPLSVSLLKVKDNSGKDITEDFTAPRMIYTFVDQITSEDNTLEKLGQKIKDSLVTPFQINPLGGRLEFSAATSYLPTGTFNIDVEVSNSKGKRTLSDACAIELIPLTTTHTIAYKRVNNDDVYYTEDANIFVDVKHESGTEGSWCIYKFVDKNGEILSPADGDIVRRSNTFPYFTDWNPYYPLTVTDTALVHQMPDYGITFPYFSVLSVGGTRWEDANMRNDFKIPAGRLNETSKDLNGLISFKFYTSGTFTITTHLRSFTKAN
ncbi:hypothetical protein [Sphingobacterium bambusae]|uniref:DUF5007 domain-containing protein n=1 Tax=Sphingobacterium bambusae TaxID=662858 RepID=A0ABW6BH78_9SPHI|nr:hypothetical protein [Sphingobacterium bambusae]WPL47602.1 hypothetical protein SCB77_16730 [Sphingobacterium bambusae]